jgi:hypothetical protein
LAERVILNYDLRVRPTMSRSEWRVESVRARTSDSASQAVVRIPSGKDLASVSESSCNRAYGGIGCNCILGGRRRRKCINDKIRAEKKS